MLSWLSFCQCLLKRRCWKATCMVRAWWLLGASNSTETACEFGTVQVLCSDLAVSFWLRGGCWHAHFESHCEHTMCHLFCMCLSYCTHVYPSHSYTRTSLTRGHELPKTEGPLVPELVNLNSRVWVQHIYVVGWLKTLYTLYDHEHAWSFNNTWAQCIETLSRKLVQHCYITQPIHASITICSQSHLFAIMSLCPFISEMCCTLGASQLQQCQRCVLLPYSASGC